jgi:class 3 adenylate cyclase
VAERRGYAKSGDAYLGYSVRGDGPIDLVYLNNNTIATDSCEEEPHAVHFFGRLASFTRLIRYDVRGVGISDPLDPARPPTIERSARDAAAVLDAVGSEHAVFAGESSGGLIAVELAATRPERISALVLVNTYARLVQADDYPIGHPTEIIETFLAQNVDPEQTWTAEGSDDVGLIAPSLRDDPAFRQWWLRASQHGAGPRSARALLTENTLADVREQLANITAPTLVLHRERNRFVPLACGQYIADHVAGAQFVALPGADHLAWAGDADALVDEIEEFVTGRRSGGGERVLTTVLFTDIVDSTRLAAALGDREWHLLLERHDAIIRRELNRHAGREVKTTGDGFLAAFDSPTQAVRGARAIVDAMAAPLEIRAGIHTGECERRGNDLGGLAVHIAARVAAAAGPGEVLVSRTVRDLVGGSDARFVDRGEHELKGVPERWQLFALER